MNTPRDDSLNRPVLGPPPEQNPNSEPALDFGDKDLRDMTPDDYAAIGFMSGLEVHQQLQTRSKLFCRCPAGTYVNHYDAEILRHMRPTLSEMGEYDGTALMEFKTRKQIHYLLERGTVCTYEIDDTPPFPIDREAVRIALEIGLLFNLNLVSELHVMRKQYLDGSIPAGFQRTVMLGVDGSVPFRVPELGIDRELRIRQLSLEEDSCREVSDTGHHVTFRTDRLGVPLTEVVTEPDLVTPSELQAAARLISRNTRRSGSVRRGPGAARQDVNVSVAGGRRVEIKGVDNHKWLPRLVHIEAFRQLNLLRIRHELRRRGVTAEMLTLPEEGRPSESSPLAIDASRSLRHCDFAPLRDALDQNGVACAVRLPGFAGLFSRVTQPGETFGTEFEDRLRVIACLTGRPFMIYSSLKGYGLRNADWRNIRSSLKASPEDEGVVVWGPTRDVDTAVREIFLRASDALIGIPAETRQAFPDGTTGFERILPGPNRMYPDTDTPPVAVEDEWVQEIGARLPERPWEQIARYQELGLGDGEARRLMDAPWSALFDSLAPPAGDIARLVATALAKRVPHHSRSRGLVELPDASQLAPLVKAIGKGRLRPEAFEVALDRILEHPTLRSADLLVELAPLPVDDPEVLRRIEKAVGLARRVKGKPADIVLRFAAGEALRPLRGRVDAVGVIDRLRRALDGSAPPSDSDNPSPGN